MILAKSRIGGLAGGTVPSLVRAPEGDLDPAVLASYANQNVTHQGWDVDTGDSSAGSNFASISAALVAGLTTRIIAGDRDIVILFHDIHSRTADNILAYMTIIETVTQSLGNFSVVYEKL